MMKFATFEKTVEYIYKYLNAPKESYTAFQQTGISFLGGYIAGIGSAIVSHPADVMVSKVNSDRKGIAISFATAPNLGDKGRFMWLIPLSDSRRERDEGHNAYLWEN